MRRKEVKAHGTKVCIFNYSQYYIPIMMVVCLLYLVIKYCSMGTRAFGNV